MSQKQNTFIIGYSVVTVLGAAILGYLCYSASTENDDAMTSLKSKQSQVDTLQKAPLYPKPENVTKKKDQVDAYSDELDKLQTSLITFQRPLDDEIKGDAVNIKLGKYKAQLEAAAQGRGIALPPGFDVGLGRYLAGAPELAAAPRVDYLVDSVNTLLTRLFQNGITKLDQIECPKQAYEEDKSGVPVVEKKATKKVVKTAEKKKPEVKEDLPAIPEDNVFTRYKVLLRFTASEKAAQDFLDEIATLGKDGPFFIINLLRVDNEKKAGPSKSDTFTPGPVTLANGATAPVDAKTAMVDSRYILGNEKISVYLDMDLVRFLDPSVAKEAPSATK